MTVEINLPFTPTIKEDESVLSFLRRAAIGNGYRSTASLIGLMHRSSFGSNKRWGVLVKDANFLKELCISLGIDIDESIPLGSPRISNARGVDLYWNGLIIKDLDLSLRTNKLCPICYSKEGYTKSEWEYVGAMACSKHNVLLSDHCPICDDIWAFNKPPMSCDCSKKKITEKLVKCSPSFAGSLKKIVKNKDQAGLNFYRSVTSAVNFWQGLGLVKNSDKALVAESLFKARWPFKERKTKRSIHPRLALATLLIEKDQRAEEIAQQLLKSFNHCAPIPRVNLTGITKKLAAKALGISGKLLGSLISEGQLELDKQNRVCARSLNKYLWRVVPDNFERMNHERLAEFRSIPTRVVANSKLEGSYVGIDEAAKLLNSNKSSVAGVLQLGLLDGDKQTNSNGSMNKWLIKKSSIRAFNKRYLFGSATEKMRNSSATSGSFVEQMQKSGIKPVSGPVIEGGITYLFHRTEVEEFLSGEKFALLPHQPKGESQTKEDIANPSLTSSETAKQLQVEVREIRTIIKQGWISAVNNRAPKLLFDPTLVSQAVMSIDEKYLDEKTAAKDLGQSVLSFQRNWINTGVVSKKKFGKQNLVLKSDIQTVREYLKESSTSATIAKKFGCERSLCQNLMRRGKLNPMHTLGTGSNKVYLFSNHDKVFENYQREQN